MVALVRSEDETAVDLIGNTPLIRLSTFETGLHNVELYAKAEWRNPGGSVKDRPAARMIADGERSGALTRDKIILDATSGNTGISVGRLSATSNLFLHTVGNLSLTGGTINKQYFDALSQYAITDSVIAGLLETGRVLATNGRIHDWLAELVGRHAAALTRLA